MTVPTHSPENSWRATTDEDHALASQRAKNWRVLAFERREYAYPWYEDPRVSLDLPTYQAWRQQQGLAPWPPLGRVREVDIAQPPSGKSKRQSAKSKKAQPPPEAAEGEPFDVEP